uniref:Putative ixodegrins large 9 n=1 Tax=Amblyomma cajennense TaxID=34607 RepID=A0A023FFZ4_AMBCJ
MMRLVLWTCATVSLLILIQEIAAYDDMVQRPIDLNLDFFGTTGSNITMTAKPKRQLGQHCSHNHPCDAGMCCVQRRRYGWRICRALAGRYRRCSDSPTKGGNYHRYCPCAGLNACEDGYCVP